MGRSYLFECPRCGYKARVSGGADRGFSFSVQTILCRDCRVLHDAVVRVKASNGALAAARPGFAWPRFRSPTQPWATPPPFDAVLNRLPFPGARQFRWVQFKLRCPVSPLHRVQLWRDPGKCPRCNAYLEKNALPFRIWE